jgi:subtilisin family serine protease
LKDKDAVPVAVIDDMFDYEHRDLVQNIDLKNSDVTLYTNGLFSDGGHGTGVAGLICAEGENHFGLVGVAWHCKLRLYAAKGVTYDSFVDKPVTFRSCTWTLDSPTRCLLLLSLPHTVDMMKKAIDAEPKVKVANMSLAFIEPNCGPKKAGGAIELYRSATLDEIGHGRE